MVALSVVIATVASCTAKDNNADVIRKCVENLSTCLARIAVVSE